MAVGTGIHRHRSSVYVQTPARMGFETMYVDRSDIIVALCRTPCSQGNHNTDVAPWTGVHGNSGISRGVCPLRMAVHEAAEVHTQAKKHLMLTLLTVPAVSKCHMAGSAMMTR